MQLPKAEDLEAIFAAAKKSGLARLRLTSGADVLEAEFAPSTGADVVVAAINGMAPIPPDPIAVVNGTVRPTGAAELPDILDALAGGGRLTAPLDQPDPTAPQ